MPRNRSSATLPHLAREEANAVRLYLQYKGYHWNVAGPLFHDLHRLFDEHAQEIFETIDPLAERQRMLGQRAPYAMEDLAAAATLPPEPGPPTNLRQMIDRLLDAHRRVIEGMREGFRAAEAEGDPGTSDLFARFVQIHEKMAWILRELTVPSPSLPELGAPMVVLSGGLPPGVSSHPSPPSSGR
ncbi:MAG TPA: DNA starvation/stationary phase protection protein [Thermoplasmata archaeon]|nr:DNA starvation/stationary phase protection protein [Thermoplasmata archaeon]